MKVLQSTASPIQRGKNEIAGNVYTKDFTIAPVDMNKAKVEFDIYRYQGSGTENWQKGLLAAEIISPNKVRLTRGILGATIHIKFRVIEHV